VSSFLHLDEGIAVCSGTAALQLAMRTLEIAPAMTSSSQRLRSWLVRTPSIIAAPGPFSPIVTRSRGISRSKLSRPHELLGREECCWSIFLACPVRWNQSSGTAQRGLWLVEDCAQLRRQVNEVNVGSFGQAQSLVSTETRSYRQAREEWFCPGSREAPIIRC